MTENAPESFATTKGQNRPTNQQGAENAANADANATIHDRTGLYISILALALAGIALGLWLNQAQIIDAKVAAAVATAKEQMQQQIADARAMAHSSDTNSRVAIDNVQQLQVQLAAKGIKVTIN